MSKKEIKLIDRVEVFDTELNIYGTFDEPYFMAKEVADWIDYRKNGKGTRDVSKMIKNLDDDCVEKYVVRNLRGTTSESKKNDRSRDSQTMLFISEDGLYDLLMISRNKKAKSFKKEVRKILKKIRKQNKQLVFNNDSILLHEINELKLNIQQAEDMLLTFVPPETIKELKTKNMFLEHALKHRFDDITSKQFNKWLMKLNMLNNDNEVKNKYIKECWFIPVYEDNGKFICFNITEFGVMMLQVIMRDYVRRHDVLHLRKKNK